MSCCESLLVLLCLLMLFVIDGGVESVAVCMRASDPFMSADIQPDGSVEFTIVFPTGGYSKGWGAIGFRSSTCTAGTGANCMASTDFLVVTASNTFEFWRLPAGSVNGMPMQLSPSQANFGLLTAMTCCVNGIAKDVTFRRAARGGPGAVDLTPNAPQTYLYAYSTNNTFGYHGATRRGAVTINLGAGYVLLGRRRLRLFLFWRERFFLWYSQVSLTKLYGVVSFVCVLCVCGT